MAAIFNFTVSHGKGNESQSQNGEIG